MEPQVIIARRISREQRPACSSIWASEIPTLVANYIPEGLHVFFQSENGLIGTGAPPRRAWRIPRSRMQAADRHRPARRLHVRQRDVVRPYSRRPSRPDRARRAPGRPARISPTG